MALIYLSGAWLAGIFLGASLELPPALILCGLIPLPLLFFNRHRRAIVLTSLCLISFFGGIWCYQQSLPQASEHHIQHYNDSGTVTIKGVLSRDADAGEKTNHLYLEADQIELAEGWQEVEGTVLLFVPRHISYSYGDELLVTGKPETPPQFADFDYKGYLTTQGIYTTMLYPEIELLDTGKGFVPMAWLYSLRGHLSQGLGQALPEPQASLAQGLLLGTRGNIPDEVRSDFALSGTAHLLAISGLHMGIMAGIVLSIGLWLFGRRHYLYIWLALGAIWFYALITGLNPPVFRAAIMVSIFLAAELLGRQRSAITALTFAAAVMVAAEPQVLRSASFQMSFMAMAGLIFVFPPLRDRGRKIVTKILGENGRMTPAAYFLSDSLSVTLAAITGVWPLIAYYFGIVSLVGPLVTLLALPALPFIIIAGSLTAALAIFALPLAQVVAWLAWLPLSYLLALTGFSASLPLSHVEFTDFSGFMIWGYYLVLGLILWINSQRQKKSLLAGKSQAPSKTVSPAARLPGRWAIAALLALVLVAATVAVNLPDDRLHVSFLDVGQGDAILIQTPDHRDILIDGGPSPQAIGLALSQKMPFWDKTIDLVVLTHPQADHLSGLVEVLKRYEVKQVLYPDIDIDSILYEEWLRLIAEKGIKATVAQAGQEIHLAEGLMIEVLSPTSPLLSGTESDINNNSLVLSLTMGRFSFLLTGDAQFEAELELISRRAVPRSMVLKIAHHGSRTTTSDEFLAVAGPQLVVISVGEENRYGHPTEEVLARLEEVVGAENIYRTDTNGTIEFITDGLRLWLRVEE